MCINVGLVLRDTARLACLLPAAALLFALSCTARAAAAPPQATATPYPPAIITFTVTEAQRGARLLRTLYPHARISVESGANAVIVIARPDDVTAMRTIATGIDVRNPTQPIVDTVQLHSVKPQDAIGRVRPIFTHARFALAPNRTIVISASQQDLAQIKAIFATIDTPPPSPTPRPEYAPQAVSVTQADVRAIARRSHVRNAASELASPGRKSSFRDRRTKRRPQRR